MKQITNVGELIDFLTKKFNREDRVELEGNGDGCYHTGKLLVNGEVELKQYCDDNCISVVW